jgi:ribosomal protein S18 acetylase RimI-like enzyme
LRSVESLRIRALRASDAGPLGDLFAELRADPDSVHFHPHAFTREEARRITQRIGIRKDLYFAALTDHDVAGYGMLRGWDEGYSIPSFGVAVAIRYRGHGIGRRLLRYATSRARRRGATKMILKVHPENANAKHLYESEGFTFDPTPVEGGQLRGTLLL